MDFIVPFVPSTTANTPPSTANKTVEGKITATAYLPTIRVSFSSDFPINFNFFLNIPFSICDSLVVNSSFSSISSPSE